MGPRQLRRRSGSLGDDPYAVLGLRPDATQRDITRSRHALEKTMHPDRLVDKKITDEQRDLMKERLEAVREAYAKIGTPEDRARYDDARARAASRAAAAQARRERGGRSGMYERRRKQSGGEGAEAHTGVEATFGVSSLANCLTELFGIDVRQLLLCLRPPCLPRPDEAAAARAKARWRNMAADVIAARWLQRAERRRELEAELDRSEALSAIASEAMSSEVAIGLSEQEAAQLEALRSSVRLASLAEEGWAQTAGCAEIPIGLSEVDAIEIIELRETERLRGLAEEALDYGAERPIGLSEDEADALEELNRLLRAQAAAEQAEARG
ncbi:hypothetical protein EMIHUDRAFT_237365 [Emiliania huxleyi CCMP1516]|uniref:J domain-containing protein n=2 Tax=Emiliania huxleyi TaxID=2903 RepID=A0A0D3JR12_EMIH1|nr:hypothetical protein EMIHUDRAFT_237365 [Emiliania huxleyi CCMP1516]EOD25947.1 hypothetical protein EMIHUDRAFT_237365 [Emiliania huxleyi CCMP1516]|eukprot:XP_005778376.1 hypothetical protein EMIHUDRAFT_237365 [Emiliania huxleyi CCMP1516]